ncbi:MAG: DUF4251 domain-containing protein [Ferruginibacter sp.]
MKNLLFLSIFCLFILPFAGLKAQNTSSTELAKKIEKHEFSFVATSMKPLKGPSRNLNSLYDVVVKKDTVISYLPFIGVSRLAPMSNEEAGIKINSQKFEYLVTDNKGDNWTVQIKFNDQPEIREFYFTIFDNGTANLDVKGTYRDPISFRGFVK